MSINARKKNTLAFKFKTKIFNSIVFDFRLKFIDPPENTTISNETVEVEEGKIPPRISCLGNGYPKLQYQWLRNGTVKSEGSILQIYKPMTRDDAGTYECVSRNKHGNQIVAMNISILCKCPISSPFFYL